MESRGGYSFTELYTMPIPYRKFVFMKMDERIRTRNEEIEASKGQQPIKPMLAYGPAVKQIKK